MNKCADCAYFKSVDYSNVYGECWHPEAVVVWSDEKTLAFDARMIRKHKCMDGQWWQYDPGSPSEPEEMEDMG